MAPFDKPFTLVGFVFLAQALHWSPAAADSEQPAQSMQPLSVAHAY